MSMDTKDKTYIQTETIQELIIYTPTIQEMSTDTKDKLHILEELMFIKDLQSDLIKIKKDNMT